MTGTLDYSRASMCWRARSANLPFMASRLARNVSLSPAPSLPLCRRTLWRNWQGFLVQSSLNMVGSAWWNIRRAQIAGVGFLGRGAAAGAGAAGGAWTGAGAGGTMGLLPLLRRLPCGVGPSWRSRPPYLADRGGAGRLGRWGGKSLASMWRNLLRQRCTSIVRACSLSL